MPIPPWRSYDLAIIVCIVLGLSICQRQSLKLILVHLLFELPWFVSRSLGWLNESRRLAIQAPLQVDVISLVLQVLAMLLRCSWIPPRHQRSFNFNGSRQLCLWHISIHLPLSCSSFSHFKRCQLLGPQIRLGLSHTLEIFHYFLPYCFLVHIWAFCELIMRKVDFRQVWTWTF